LKTTEPILVQIGTSDPRGKGTKWSTLRVRRSMENVTPPKQGHKS